MVEDPLGPHKAVFNVHSLDEGRVDETHPLLGVRVVIFNTDLKPEWEQTQNTVATPDMIHSKTLHISSPCIARNTTTSTTRDEGRGLFNAALLQAEP